MAIAQAREELFTCSICRGQYKNPRKLPGCLHIFCANCLLTYIRSTTVNAVCSICRNAIELSLNEHDLNGWINSLELASEMASNTDIEEDSTVCSLCKDKGKQVRAGKFCIHCQENFCESCSSLVHRLKILKDHIVLDLNENPADENTKLTELLSERLQCSRHSDKALSYICENEDTLCCATCVVECHRHCKGVFEVESRANKLNNDAKSKLIKEKMQIISTKIQAISEFRKRNKPDNKDKVETVVTEIQNVRARINTMFDALEENIRSEAKALFKEYSYKIDNEEETFEAKRIMLKVFSSLIDEIEVRGSTNQIFTVLHKLTNDLFQIDRETEFTCNRYDFNLHTDQLLDNLLEYTSNDTARLATIKEELTEVMGPDFHEKKYLINMTAEKIDDRDILAKNSPGGDPTYRGVLYFWNDQLLLVDEYYNLCCLTDQDCKPIGTCNTENTYGKPFCATEVRNSFVAISFPEQKRICVISARDKSENIEIVGDFITRFSPKALFGLKNGNIAVSCEKPVAFGILTFTCSLYVTSHREDVYFHKDTNGRGLKTFDYMTVDEKRSHVIQPCTKDKAVYCFDYQGNPKFVYTHEELKTPKGVACDSEGNIYVYDESKSAIHVLTPDGIGHHIIRDGCPRSSLAIAFASDGKQFAVTHNCSAWHRVTFFRLS